MLLMMMMMMVKIFNSQNCFNGMDRFQIIGRWCNHCHRSFISRTVFHLICLNEYVCSSNDDNSNNDGSSFPFLSLSLFFFSVSLFPCDYVVFLIYLMNNRIMNVMNGG